MVEAENFARLILAADVCRLSVVSHLELAMVLMRAAVFGVGVVGPAVLLGIPLVLAGAAALAIYIPAQRAVKIDPMAALRNE